MDVLSSAEFRKRYASLTEPTTVTVNGHAIGEWRPLSVAQSLVREAGIGVDEGTRAFGDLARGYSTRPFTPVPKIRSK